MSGEKKEITFEINTDSDDMLEKIVEEYKLPDKSKAIRVLLDYVEEKESDWDDMFATVRCNRCEPLFMCQLDAASYLVKFI